jgi:putative FmdB family regulatory protein
VAEDLNMAIYEFDCRSCGKRFEVRMPMSTHEDLRQALPACPACGKAETRQVVSTFSCKTPVG